MTSMPADAPSLLRNRNFLWFWGGDAISQLGAQFSQLAIPVLAVTLLGATEFEVGVLGAAQTAAFLLVGLPAGAWIDRMLKRRVMIVADLVRAVALAAMPALWFAGVPADLARLPRGRGARCRDRVLRRVVPELPAHPAARLADRPARTRGSRRPRRSRASADPASRAPCSPWSRRRCCCSPTASRTSCRRSRSRACATPSSRSDPAQRQSLPKEIGEGLRFVFGHPLIRRIVGTTATTNFFSMIVFTLEAVLILRELGFEPWVFGLILSVGSVGGLLGAIATPWVTRRVGEGTSLSIAAVGFGVAILALPLAGAFPALAIPILIAGTFLESFLVLLYNITQVTMRQRLCPPRLLGRMNASIRFVVWGVMPIASLLAGVLGTTIGTLPTMWIGAVGTFLGAGFVLFSPLTAHEGAAEGTRGQRTTPRPASPSTARPSPPRMPCRSRRSPASTRGRTADARLRDVGPRCGDSAGPNDENARGCDPGHPFVWRLRATRRSKSGL